MTKRIAVVGLALLLALSVAACSTGKDGTPTDPAPVGDKDPKAPGAYRVNPIAEDAAPQALRDWAAAEQDKTEPNHKVHTQDGVTYIAVSAGQQSSGGWTGAAQHIGVTVTDKGDVLDLDVVFTPPAGLATMALTNPVVYFRADPALVGEVKVRVQVQGAATPQAEQKPITFSVEQSDGMGGLVFHATGELDQPKVEYRLNGQVLGSTELKAQPTGEWTWSMPRPKEQSEQIEIHLISGGQSVKVAPMRYETAVSSRWSSNFYVETPRQLGTNTVLLKGKARVFEAVFIVEIRHEGQVLARKPIMAKGGAPEYGDFEEQLKLDGELPLGAEAWFIIESMKDGSDMVELIAPIYNGK